MRGTLLTYPDQTIYAGDCPFTWDICLRLKGRPYDVTGLALTCPVTDDGEEKGALNITVTDAQFGEVSLTLTDAVFSGLRRYSTWLLRDNTGLHRPLARGRIVRAV